MSINTINECIQLLKKINKEQSRPRSHQNIDHYRKQFIKLYDQGKPQHLLYVVLCEIFEKDDEINELKSEIKELKKEIKTLNNKIIV